MEGREGEREGGEREVGREGRGEREGGRGGRGGSEGGRERGREGGARTKSPIRPPTLRNITSSNVER